ncbi:hypothetical protein SAMN02800692_2090 [Luteibacter sp. UNC138MFCol5.1]|uniref:DUF7931 domain-containing protein n=1 Tax=Luteibacter sp. UNC138MFCol5.1 TaxID=1502774 RepID=UPI0008B2FA93|nr:hypothetical protein [Luteibacter sp. UNC138MFCol5.1]SEO77855.1 hypothetical protein SAMN02800692_2090 [Luteibacter sp. UNC138MFCol5.1]
MTPAGRPLAADDRASLEAALLQLLAGARHRLAIYLPTMEPGILENEAALAELRRLATSGRHAQVRILTHDAERAHREGHRLVALAQRLPTAMTIRVPTDESHLRYASAFVTDLAGGFLFRPSATRFEARGDLDAPGETSRLTAYFDEVWERAEPAWQIRPLGI